MTESRESPESSLLLAFARFQASHEASRVSLTPIPGFPRGFPESSFARFQASREASGRLLGGFWEASGAGRADRQGSRQAWSSPAVIGWASRGSGSLLEAQGSLPE